MGGGTAIGRVRGLGSAGHGGEHWIKERVSSAALLLLGAWFLVSLLLLPGPWGRKEAARQLDYAKDKSAAAAHSHS